MRYSNSASRFNIIIIMVVVLAIVCVARLFDLQIIKGSEYEETSNHRLVRAYSVPAPRGEILDKNNKAIVKNRMGYSVQVQKVDMTTEELNKSINDIVKLVAQYDLEIDSVFPIIIDEKTGEMEYDFTIEENGGTRRIAGIKAEIIDEEDDEEDQAQEEKDLENWKKKNKLTEYSSISDIYDYYKKKYEVSSQYNDEEAMNIVAIRYGMEKGGFSEKTPYTIARDIDELAVQQIKEQFMKYRGIEVVIEPVRVYVNGTMAAHILGRTGKIYAEEYAELKDKGYGMNDYLGKDGLEKVLEEYLKGQDGYKNVEMNRGGGVSQILKNQEPKPGNYARLTIDSDLQRVMERALKDNIARAYGLDGAGAAIAIDPKTGGVLAMASYPSYDLTSFNEDYDKLLKSKSKPLINRVLNGTYSPGSTFKPLTSIAALETGIIKPNTYIQDKGKYTYFDGYQPTCLIYSSEGRTHGTINVSEAIGVSCNYFFYEVGRQTGIETINEYATKFGLGEKTGIELPESTGILASPQNREKNGGVWYPGDVLQASIGQSDNMFTPAQLASYIATILNRGKRYSLHLVDQIVDYDTGEIVIRNEPKMISKTNISEETYNAVVNGMRRVVTSGTAKASFETAKYKAAGKTGTAEVPNGRDNVLFVGFAPYDEPEIVIAVVIEHGANSAYAANVARAVFDAYMEIKEGKFEAEEQTESKKTYEETEPIITNEDNKEKNSGKSGVKPENNENKEQNNSSGVGTL